jgi:hypothetical protein
VLRAETAAVAALALAQSIVGDLGPRATAAASAAAPLTARSPSS